MKTILTIIVSCLSIHTMTSCAKNGVTPVKDAPARVNNGFATTFQRGDFVPDRCPLEPSNTRDLREMAMTLPVWESEISDGMKKWIYENSSTAVDTDTWTAPADGAQSAIRLKRLADSPDGSQRIELWIPPSKSGSYPQNMISWSSVLQRRDRGWLVESARTING